MKFTTPKNSPIALLYEAANEIVIGARKAFKAAGQDSREVRLPILMQGTDLRVTIEAGPKIAARNAIEHAQMTASGKPVEPVIDVTKTLIEAQDLLELYAREISDGTAVDEGDLENAESNILQQQQTLDRIRAVLEKLNEVKRLL